MEILGYVGFAALILLAATWTIGVRVQLGAGVHTIFGALFFLVAAIVLTVSDADKLHSLWIVPAGFVLAALLSLLAVHAPPLFSIFRLLASGFAAIVRVGIPRERIEAALQADVRATIDRGERAVLKDDELFAAQHSLTGLHSLTRLIRIVRQSFDVTDVDTSSPKAELAQGLFYLGMIDAASQFMEMTDEQFLNLFEVIFHDLGFGKDISSRVLLFHQSLQTSHPAFPAVMRGGDVYLEFVNGNETIPLTAGTLIADYVRDPLFPTSAETLGTGV